MRPAHFVLAAALGVLAVLGTGFAGTAVASPSLAPPPVANPAGVGQHDRADASDFAFDSMHSDFRLGRDADGRSTLSTTETIVARFPDSDQNHGIRRAIPTHYDGHPTGLDLQGVTDENGTPRDYDAETTSIESSNGSEEEFLEVTIAADDYVHGAQTYVITYRQSNVTLFPSDRADEEFFWEVNGTGWDQSFGEVSASLRVAPALVPRLTGQTTCFQGGSESRRTCDAVTGADSGAGWRVDASGSGLGPHEGLTVVVGFTPGTFVPRDDSFTANPFPGIGLAAALLGVVTAILAGVARATRWRNRPGRPTIIAEYLPPEGVNLLTAGEVSGTTARAMAAQFLSFAVRGNLRVLEATKGKNRYLLELVQGDGLDPAERRILTRLFPGLRAGDRRDLGKKDAALAGALQSETRSARKRSVAEGLRERKGGAPRRWLLALAILSGVVSVVAGIVAGVTEVGGAWPVLTLVVGVLSAGTTLALAAVVRPLTDAGAELRDYLKGVKLYIGLAEADRLRVLQSPEGALRSPDRDHRADGAVHPAQTLPARAVEAPQVLKLYERLLPFAVLFGQEKKWSGVLGEYYARTGSSPDWYSGAVVFNAAYFATAIGAFSSATTASWSGSAGSSSSSGFGGGGSVGGGGGGGGGGGV